MLNMAFCMYNIDHRSRLFCMFIELAKKKIVYILFNKICFMYVLHAYILCFCFLCFIVSLK